MNSPTGQEFHTRSALRDHSFRYAGLAAVVAVAPFAVSEFLKGHFVLGGVSTVLLLLLLLDIFRLPNLKRPPVERPLMLGLAAAILCYAALEQGVLIAFWSFPLIIAFHFILAARPALVLNVLFLAGLVPGMLLVSGWAQTLSMSASLLLTSVLAFVFPALVHRQRELLEQQVILDPLTGAYNRRHFNLRLAELVHRHSRHKHPCSLILFDIDHFKRINDQYGHDVGDRVLRILVETVKARIRLTDEIFRLGGEEFVILLPDTRIEAGAKLAQDITDMVANIRMIEGGPVTISCGVGELQENEEGRDWLNRCDFALYTAKHEGRGRVSCAPDRKPDSGPGSNAVRDLNAPATYHVV